MHFVLFAGCLYESHVWYCMLKDWICAHLVVVVDEEEDLHTVHALSVHSSCTHPGLSGAQKEPHVLTTCGWYGIHAVLVTYLLIDTCRSFSIYLVPFGYIQFILQACYFH